jgi:hypothetical protein
VRASRESDIPEIGNGVGTSRMAVVSTFTMRRRPESFPVGLFTAGPLGDEPLAKKLAPSQLRSVARR